jgi:uncharacterized protein (TIGR02453 family)
MPTTRYFTSETFDFLTRLENHNDRDWFAERKDEYQRVAVEPSLRLIEAISRSLVRTAPMIKAEAKRQGGSLMRVYRDIRFSKNKLPFKTHIGIQLRHEAGRDIHAPGCYIHISPRESFLGVGIWRPASNVLTQIREAIIDQPQRWLAAKKSVTSQGKFQLAGDSLKRPPRGIPAEHPQIDDLRRKDFIAVCALTGEEVLSDQLPKTIVARVRKSGPLMQFLCESLGLLY